MIRVGPAVGLLHTLYATYFLCRSINSRPPASCASYQMFAGLLDVGLIPFFAIACYMAYLEHSSTAYGWTTLFSESGLTYSVVQAFMLLSGVVGGLLVVSLVVDIYLAVIYRKITNIPPDMNPLEEKDNLTARPHHKRNKSELVYKKHLSGSTLASERYSKMSKLSDEGRRIPFKHTRTDSADRDSFSFKRDFVNEIKDPYSVRASMQLEHDNSAPSRPSSAITPAANARVAGSGLEHKPARSSALATSPVRRSSWFSEANYEGVPVEAHDYEYENYYRSTSPVSAISEQNKYPPSSFPGQTQAPRPSTAPQRPPVHYQQVTCEQENDMPSPEQLSLALPPSFHSQKKRSREPLGMNPPTPVNERFHDPSLLVQPLALPGYATPPRSPLRDTDTNSVTDYGTPASRPASFVGSGTKSRFYGNLRGSLGGSPTRTRSHELDDEDITRSNTTKSAESGNFEVYASDSDSDSIQHSDVDYDPYRSHPTGPMGLQQPPAHGLPVLIGDYQLDTMYHGQRQVSNSTGHDLHNGYAGLDPEFANAIPRRREVSGKIAEEGRGFEITTQPVQVKSAKPGAAGWARFKGL